ncbi:chaperone protein DnaJ-like isoform X1 [Salvia splendens]|uniref:chaperone protein DnaJ-like isoform X1 n=1 Tax=Salvia splendens TaxID=180675 RepID=UPI001C27F7FA|nr:chaperone protein DnaJ-like isoform X1 [Salvia splendens]XP_042020578.1 chaperone protein DnaJ-like isoform X1 [Salvia splendens]
MAGEEDKSCDFYAVLELKKECTSAELRHAYKKLALKWHPDRFSASGNSKYLDETKKKFQAIQQAYSENIQFFRSLVIFVDFLCVNVLTYHRSWWKTVLSDTNKRFLYDAGVYDSDHDDDNHGMGEFLNEMTTMMSQTKSQESGHETLEELQELFDKLFESDINGSSRSSKPPTCSSSSSSASGNEAYGISSKWNSREAEASHFEGFCLGTGGGSGKRPSGESSRKRSARLGRR